MNVFISDLLVKKDKYGPDYYWIVGQLPSGKKAIIEDIYFDLRKYKGQHIEMLLSFMRSPYSEQRMGIHNTSFIPEKFYSVELIDELLNTKGVASVGNERVIILNGEYIESYSIPEKWIPLIQRTAFKALFAEPSALKTEDGIYLLYPFHSRRQDPAEEISQDVIMAGTLRLEAWLPIYEDSLVESFKDSIENSYPKNKMDFVNIKGLKKINVDHERQSLNLNGLGIKKIKDIFGLQNLYILQRLELQGNKLTSVEGLENLKNLRELFLSGNKISKIEDLNLLPHLGRLFLASNKFSRIHGLDGMTNLRELGLNINDISHIQGLDTLSNLLKLDLGINNITRIEGLDNLINLRILILNSNKITNIEGLHNLRKLEILHLDRNPLVSIKGIESLTNLKELYLDNTKITSIINEIDKLPNLKLLTISGRLGYIPYEEFRYLIEEKGLTIVPYGIPPYEPS